MSRFGDQVMVLCKTDIALVSKAWQLKLVMSKEFVCLGKIKATGKRVTGWLMTKYDINDI